MKNKLLSALIAVVLFLMPQMNFANNGSSYGITGNSQICDGGSTQLCAPSGAGYLWSTTETTQCITVSVLDVYSVTVTKSNGAKNVYSKRVTLSPAPDCTISGNPVICDGQAARLSAPDGCESYLWSTGETTRSIRVGAAGPVSVTVTNRAGCSSTCNTTVTASTSPPSTITGEGVVCTGATTQLCAPADAGSYLWSTGETSTCITVSVAGKVSIKVTNAGCSSYSSRIVTFNPPCTIKGSGYVCDGGTTQLCAPDGAATYLWSTGETTTCITISTPGTYYDTITSLNGCQSYCSKTVALSPAPSCLISGNPAICDGQSAHLSAPEGCEKYLWSTGETTRSIRVSVAGPVSVTVTNRAGCSSTCNTEVTVTPVPSSTITGEGVVCNGASTQLCVPEGAESYLWSTGETTSCITVSTAGTVHITASNGACSSSSYRRVGTTPSCYISGNSYICSGGTVELCAPSYSFSVLWSTGETTNCITVSAPGTYYDTITSSGGCQSYCSKTVILSPDPDCTINGSGIICDGGYTRLYGPDDCDTYLWSTGETTRSIKVSVAGPVSLTVTNRAGCSSTCTRDDITVSEPPSCDITGELNPLLGQSTTLCAPPDLSSYKWSRKSCDEPFSSDPCVTVTRSGSYTVVVSNSDGCRSTCSATVSYSAGKKDLVAGPDSDPASSDGNLEVNAYPNPFSSAAVVEFQNTESNSHVVIELYNVAGAKVVTLFDENVQQSIVYKAELNAERLAAGVYNCKVINGHQVINKKLILIR